MKSYEKLFENLNRVVCKSRMSACAFIFAATVCLSLTSCLEPEGDWGDLPDTEPGLNLADRLYEIHRDAQSGSEHTIVLTGGGSIGAQDLSFAGRSNITIRLKGDGKERTVTLADKGSLFTIGAGVTLILDNGITLWGQNENNASLIRVNTGGSLIMKVGSKVSANDGRYSSAAGGVTVVTGGIFIMEGGEISGNTSRYAGGVYVADGGDFLMQGGKISGNTNSSDYGGGIRINGRLTMTNGEISHNTALTGGGMYISGGNVTMSGGRVFGNTANTTSTSSGGGGMYVSNATFTMTGGDIAFNSAPSGGGVFATGNATFVKTGGTIYGYVISDSNRNTARAGVSGTDRGHAVFVNSSPNKRRETTAGPGLNLDSGIPGAAGGWE